jgi:hypothetical protein
MASSQAPEQLLDYDMDSPDSTPTACTKVTDDLEVEPCPGWDQYQDLSDLDGDEIIPDKTPPNEPSDVSPPLSSEPVDPSSSRLDQQENAPDTQDPPVTEATRDPAQVSTQVLSDLKTPSTVLTSIVSTAVSTPVLTDQETPPARSPSYPFICHKPGIITSQLTGRRCCIPASSVGN